MTKFIDKAVGRFGAAPLPDFASLWARGQKDGVLDDMISTVKGLLGAGENRKHYALAWLELGKAIQALIVSQNPDFTSQASQVAGYFAEISELELKLAEAEVRNAEDFRDIIERYDILFKANEAWLSARAAQKEASDALNEAIRNQQAQEHKPGYEKKASKLEAEVAKCKAIKGRVLEKNKAALQKLIDTRNAYTKLKVRRLKHGWTLYGATLKEVAEAEIGVLKKLKDAAASLKVGGVSVPIPGVDVESGGDAHVVYSPPPVVYSPSPGDDHIEVEEETFPSPPAQQAPQPSLFDAPPAPADDSPFAGGAGGGGGLEDDPWAE